ncbi:uncharacterized protein LOC131950950 [Physella acuta]|uniref:uncharacterized protein LOC131938419 n=1 Tax=Physella acuta TaxID=109671 RepID=UPI0027DC20D3|nr:uncharacterized protein LOC131938419 [Physella acuta]XP_059157036.1 uncharacterized protein LOC131941667 [Physella acuta]XP_059169155.1 uncharacterized protein LOC131950950 [Physella acuta]
MYHLLETVEDNVRMVMVVPDVWLLAGKNQCYWPSTPTAGDAWVRNAKEPCESWQIFTYEKILHSNVSYEKIKSLERKALDKSDVESSGSEPHRQSRPTIRWSPNDDSESSESSPARKKQCRVGVRRRSRSPIPSIKYLPQPPEASKAVPKPPASYAQFSASPSFSGFTQQSTDQLMPFFKKIMENNAELLEEIRRLHRKVDRLEAKLNGMGEDMPETIQSLPEGYTFPLETVEQMVSLDSCLNDTAVQKRMSLYLSNYGGKNARHGLFRVLKELISPQLSTLYSFEGKKGKLKFNDLRNLKMTIFDSILRSFKNSTIKELEKGTSEWLAMSGDRAGGRKRREGPNKQLHNHKEAE